MNKVDFKSHHSGKDNESGGGLSTKSDVAYHKWGKTDHVQICCQSNISGFNGYSSNNSIRELLEWITKNPFVSSL